MKNYKLKIINSKGETINFNVLEPTNITELTDGINDLADFDGMVVFAIKPDLVVQPMYIQNFRHISLDVISVDWHGNIKMVHKNVDKDKSVNLHPDAVCVVELKAGLCDKYDIYTGDTVIHKKLKFLSSGKIKIYGKIFEKISAEKIQSIKVNDIIFAVFVRGGGGDLLPNTALIITNGHGLYYIDLSVRKNKYLFQKYCDDEFFAFDTDDTNTVFVHKKYRNKFINSSNIKTMGDLFKTAHAISKQQ